MREGEGREGEKRERVSLSLRRTPLAIDKSNESSRFNGFNEAIKRKEKE